MLLSIVRPLAWAAVLATAVSGSPTPVEVSVGRPQNDLLFREALELAHQPHLEKRLSADFDMTRSWKNEVLFHGSYVTKDAVGITDTVSLAVMCVDCYTKGTVTAKLTDEAIIDPSVRLEFSGVEAYVDMRVAMSAGATYSLNLFTSQSPIGLGFPGLSLGVVFYVDLVFSMTDEIELEGGFYVKVADGAYLEASVFGGDITKSFFDGLSSKSLPITVISGKATFKADLRLRVQCGAEAELLDLGLGAGAELGIYANLIEFVAVLESTPTCALQSSEWWDLNVGAYVHLDVVIDYKTLGAIPTVSTTLLSAPTATQCWIEGSGSGSGSGASGGLTYTITASTTPIGVSAGASTSSAGTESQPTITDSPSLSASVSASASRSLSGSPTFSYGGSNSSSPVTTAGPATSSGSGDDLVTSTVYTTSVYTITACGADVVNCPASYQSEIVVTQTVDIYTTVCPASATITPPAPSSSPAPESTAATVIVDVITDVVVLVPCESPIVETFVPPTSTAAVMVPTGGASIPVKVISTAAPLASSVPAVGGGKQYQNGTASSLTLGPYGTGRPSSSLVQATTTAASVKPTVATAGAGRALGGGLLTTVAALGAWMLLL